MNTKLDLKRILIFLAFAFGIAWATALVIYRNGGLVNSPVLAPNLPLAIVLMATFYMWAPALANIFTRLITGEGFKNTGLRPNFKKSWRLWVAAWLLPGLLTLLGGAIFFLIFPQYFDPGLSAVKAMLEKAGQTGKVDPWMVVITQTLSAILVSPLINTVFAFGEEFGWRGYLLPKMLPLGSRRTLLIMGAIWGVWHWPVIFMGYEYGFDYPGTPWLGPLVFLWFTFVLGVILAWVTLRSGSVWPAAIGHAAVNGMAGLMAFFVQGTPNPLLGPIPVGLIGAMGYGLLAAVLFFNAKALAAPAPQPVVEAPSAMPAVEVVR